MRYTFEVTLGDDAPEWHHLRVSMLLRKMANLYETSNGALISEGSSQGHNFECIKLTKVEPDAN